jgi:universal stress protein A
MLPFKKILCPTDFSEASHRALAAANELALRFAAELIVVHVVPPIPLGPGPPPSGFNVPLYQQELVASCMKLLQEIVAQRLAKELKVRTMVLQGAAAEFIVRLARQEGADLIVIASHGETGWRRFVFGSVAEKVVRDASCPVLTIQAAREAEES